MRRFVRLARALGFALGIAACRNGTGPERQADLAGQWIGVVGQATRSDAQVSMVLTRTLDGGYAAQYKGSAIVVGDGVALSYNDVDAFAYGRDSIVVYFFNTFGAAGTPSLTVRGGWSSDDVLYGRIESASSFDGEGFQVTRQRYTR